MKTPKATAADDQVLVFVRPVTDAEYGTPSSSIGHERYLLLKRGMTIGEFLDIDLRGNQPRRADIAQNVKVRTGQSSPNLVLADPLSVEAIAARHEYVGQSAGAAGAADAATLLSPPLPSSVTKAAAPMLDPKKSRLICEVDFEKNGKQTGYVRLFHSVHASAYGFIPIPIVVIKNGTGPTAVLVSGNHGDEYEGQVALSDLARRLEPEKIQGRVIILPMANFAAGMAGRRTSPIDEVNLNRAFPGDPNGTVTQQIAYWIESTLLPKADFVADLHSGGSSLMYVPCALMKLSGNEKRETAQRAMLEAFGAPINYITPGGSGTGQDNTLSGGAERLGIPAIGTELAGSGTVTPAALRIVRRGLNNLLVHAGILPESERIEITTPPRVVTVAGPEHFVYASESGVWEPVAELGQTVTAGQVAARIHTPETPWRGPVTLRFEADGIVLCKRIPGRTMRGDCLFHLGA
jgi:hypothetical protein